MRIELRRSAVKDLQKISEPFKTKLHDKILLLATSLMLPILKNSLILNLLIVCALAIIVSYSM